MDVYSNLALLKKIAILDPKINLIDLIRIIKIQKIIIFFTIRFLNLIVKISLNLSLRHLKQKR